MMRAAIGEWAVKRYRDGSTRTLEGEGNVGSIRRTCRVRSEEQEVGCQAVSLGGRVVFPARQRQLSRLSPVTGG